MKKILLASLIALGVALTGTAATNAAENDTKEFVLCCIETETENEINVDLPEQPIRFPIPPITP